MAKQKAQLPALEGLEEIRLAPKAAADEAIHHRLMT